MPKMRPTSSSSQAIGPSKLAFRLSFKRFVSDAESGGCTGSDGASTETGNLLIVLILIAVDLLIVAGKKRQKDEHENDNEDEHDGKRAEPHPTQVEALPREVAVLGSGLDGFK
jgi:hypothetical protein